jgi:hypothetical protein
MEVEIVFTGLCAAVNLDNSDTSIIGPSMILLRADKSMAHEHLHHLPGGATAKEETYVHIPFIAFDTRKVAVNDTTFFFPVPSTFDRYLFYELKGLELAIPGHLGVPILDSTYNLVARNDLYWPEARDKWNNDVVPKAGQGGNPKLVAAIMKIGGGTISGGRLCPHKWRFEKLNGETLARHFAEEIVFKYDEPDGDLVRIDLLDMENPKPSKPLRTLLFRPVNGNTKVTLILGNNTMKDMDTAVRRQRGNANTGPGEHFALFNKLIDLPANQTPKPPEGVPGSGPGGTGGGGGTDGGACGPKGHP